jgi:GGDEF domain-containing protein
MSDSDATGFGGHVPAPQPKEEGARLPDALSQEVAGLRGAAEEEPTVDVEEDRPGGDEIHWRGPKLIRLLEETERELLQEALADAGGNQTRAAEFLGISEARLRYKMRKYGLQRRRMESAAVTEAGVVPHGTSGEAEGGAPPSGARVVRAEEEVSRVSGDPVDLTSPLLAEEMRREFLRCKRCRGRVSLLLAGVDCSAGGGTASDPDWLGEGHNGEDRPGAHWENLVRRCVRSTDLVTRNGAEAVAVLLSNAGREEAKIVADRVCETVLLRSMAEHEAGHQGMGAFGSDVAVVGEEPTVSVGVASYSGHEAVDPEELLLQAAFALDRARRRGGIRVDVFSPDDEWQSRRTAFPPPPHRDSALEGPGAQPYGL